MTTCAPSCNAGCCSPVMLPYTVLEVMRNEAIAPEERRWAERCLTPMPMKEAMQKAPWLKGRLLTDASGRITQPFFYRCSNFDTETRKCTDYDNRPSMCRDFPWYGEEPRGGATLPPDCSYRQDLIQIGRKP